MENQKRTMELHPREINLILKIRHKYQFGKIEIETRNGLPEYITREVVRDNLNAELSTDEYVSHEDDNVV